MPVICASAVTVPTVLPIWLAYPTLPPNAFLGRKSSHSPALFGSAVLPDASPAARTCCQNSIDSDVLVHAFHMPSMTPLPLPLVAVMLALWRCVSAAGSSPGSALYLS